MVLEISGRVLCPCTRPVTELPDGHLGDIGVMVWNVSHLASELNFTKWMVL